MNKYGALVLSVGGTLAATAASADERSVQRQVTADANGEVSIDNVAGSIIVSAWDRPQGAVHAELGADALQLSVSSEPGHTRVRIDGYTDHPGNLVHLFAEVGAEAQLRVQVPRGSQLTVTGVSADIRSTGVIGAQHLISACWVMGTQGKSTPPASAACASGPGCGRRAGHEHQRNSTAGDQSGGHRASAHHLRKYPHRRRPDAQGEARCEYRQRAHRSADRGARGPELRRQLIQR